LVAHIEAYLAGGTSEVEANVQAPALERDARCGFPGFWLRRRHT
jgi:hypothetical protein